MIYTLVLRVCDTAWMNNFEMLIYLIHHILGGARVQQQHYTQIANASLLNLGYGTQRKKTPYFACTKKINEGLIIISICEDMESLEFTPKNPNHLKIWNMVLS